MGFILLKNDYCVVILQAARCHNYDKKNQYLKAKEEFNCFIYICTKKAVLQIPSYSSMIQK